MRERSRAAVAKAGTRDLGAPSQSAGAWNPRRGKLPESETFRPGKTKHERRRSS